MDGKTQDVKAEKGGKKQTTGEDLIRSYQRSIPSLTLKEGLPFPGLLLTKRFDEIKHFEVREEDLLIAGYPRSGDYFGGTWQTEDTETW